MTFAAQLSAAFVPIASAYDSPSTTRALSWAQSFVEAYCNRSFDLVTSDVSTISPQRYRTALLPYIPVVNVEQVQALLPQVNSSVPTGGMVWTTLTNYRYVSETGLIYDTTGEPGVISTLGLTWPRLPNSLMVTYDHGYTTVPQPLIDAACRFAQQYLENPALVAESDVGEVRNRYAAGEGGRGGDAWGTGGAIVPINPFDRMILDRYTDITVG